MERKLYNSILVSVPNTTHWHCSHSTCEHATLLSLEESTSFAEKLLESDHSAAEGDIGKYLMQEPECTASNKIEGAN